MLRLLAFVLLLAPAAHAQVADDFSDSDFSADPPWTGNADRFTVVPFGTDFALRSDGLAASDTITLATASTVAAGRWAFTFHWEANLTNANGTRVYLVADTPDLGGDVFGYYVQLGTNNSDEIRLYRQDGPTTARVALGASEVPVVAGDEGTVSVVVLRDAAGGWRVSVGGAPVVEGVQDATYTASAALGVWLKHSSANGAAFFWDDFVADPDFDVDLTPPVPESVTVLDGGGTLRVRFSEALAPATVAVTAFSVDGIGPPLAAALLADGHTVELSFVPPLPPGDYVLAVEGVEDLAGNATPPGTTIAFAFETDDTPPELLSAEAVSATRVDVTFSEPVAGCDASLYAITPEIGVPTGIGCPDGDAGAVYGLLLGTPLTGPQTYTVTATDVMDLAGNVQPSTSASFFFGTFATPEPGEIVINEIMYDPPDGASNEYLELVNRTADRTFDLSALTLSDDGDDPATITDTPTALGPGGYAVLVRDAEAFEAAFPDVSYVLVDDFPALNNSGDTPTLRLGDTVLDAVPYAPSWGGRDASLERRSADGPSDVASNWATSTAPSGGTPGATNSVPPDTAPPHPTDADISADGRMLSISFDEPLDPATVAPGAFVIEEGPNIVTAEYSADESAVVLTLADAPEPGTYTVTITDVADLLGNVTQGAQVAFTFDPDRTPPALVRATALEATTVEVQFSEAVAPASAGDTGNYAVSDGVGTPAAVQVAPDGNARRVLLSLAVALAAQQAYTLTVENIADLAGNVLAEDQKTFYFGEGDVPAPGDLVVNEILYDPPNLASNEYVELLNTSDKALDLGDFTLADEANTTAISEAARFVLPGDYAVLVNNAESFAAAFPNVAFVEVPDFPSLNNSGDAVVIAYEGEARIVTDSVRYRPDWGGTDASLERRSPSGPGNSAGNWGTTLAAVGTPGAANTLPPDTTPPQPEDVDVANDGQTLTVVFAERLDPTSVTADAFVIDDNVAPVAVTYADADDPLVVLTLAEPLGTGERTLTVSGVRDLQGNTADEETIAFTFNPDRTPPALLGVSAPDPNVLTVLFSEAVGTEAGDAARYTVSDGIGVASATVAPEGDAERVRLTLDAPLEEGVVYTLTVRDIPDLFGNVLTGATARVLLGGGAAPGPAELVVTEIMYDLPSERNGEEYVELYNASGRPLDLGTVTLSDTGAPGPLVAAPTPLLPGEYLAVVADAAAFRARFPNAERFVQADRFPSLGNREDAVVLRAAGSVVDSVFYSADWQRPELDDATGVALEKIAPDGPSTDAQSWTSSLDPAGGTPGARNSVFLPPGEAPATPGLSADPSPFDASVGTQISYTLDADAALVRLRIFDGAGRLVRTLEDAALGGNARTGNMTWQGRDDENRPLRVGIYVLLLEALDLEGGRTEVYKEVVVLGRRL